MRLNIKKITALLLISVMLLAISSCSKVEEGTNDDARDVFVYSSQTIDLFEDDASLQVYNVIPYEDCYYAIVQSASEFGVGAISEVYLYCINSDGVIQSKIELDNNLNVYGDSEIVNDELLYVTYFGNIEKVNIHTGEKVFSEETHNDIVGISSCDDGYVVWGVGRIDKYDKENKLVASIENDQWGFYSGYNTFYQDGDDCYLLSYGGWSYSYYKLNFEKGTSQLVYTPGKTEDCSGKYVFNTDGEFLLDIENSCMYPLAIWNEMNLQPPQYTQAEPTYIGIDDESFIQVYNYEGGFAQIVLYSYEGTENFSDRTYITVGGFGCNNDLSLMLAIYKFNTSQDEYRVVVEDYFDEFSGSSYEDSVVQKAALIKYFNDGNEPDIYYGNYFDYEYYASNGITLDMSQYMTDDFKANFDKITPNIRDLMLDSEGRCYTLFSSYQIKGYFSALDVDNNMSIDDVTRVSEELGVTMFCNEWAVNIAINTIPFDINSGKIRSSEDIQKILEFAFENGIDVPTGTSIGEEINRFNIGDYLLRGWSYCGPIDVDCFLNDYGTTFTYVGYPSVAGSNHVITPFGRVAVSANTEYPEECCQFISFLLDDDVQDISNMSSTIPVNDECMRKMVEYSADHSTIPDEEFAYKMYVGMFHEIDHKAVEKYYEYISEVDTVEYYDWDVLNIISDEVDAHYRQDKPADVIAESMYSRLQLYFDER
ncbi:MAG: hypothetical protein MJ166_09320 [Clostridia bacterium]|nr:hypothetical protein [Clostridia bacterium]